MAQINVLADGEALRVLIRQDRSAASFRLTHHIGGSGLIQEAVVDAARVPCIDTVCTAERGIADERVPTTIVVVCVVVGAIVVLLHAS